MTIPSPPAARSFKPRRRGLSAARLDAYSRAFERFGIAVDGPQLSLAEEFGCAGPYVIDIGFGAGEALLEMARRRPAECVIGVEVHTPGLAAVLDGVAAAALTNVRVVDGDAVELLARLPTGSLDEVRIWFPDPWPKQRQRHRRLVRADVLGPVVDRLRRGGRLHLATDVADYSLQIQQLCDADGRLQGGVIARPPWRPITRFETRGVTEGRQAVDLLYTRRRCRGSHGSSRRATLVGVEDGGPNER